MQTPPTGTLLERLHELAQDPGMSFAGGRRRTRTRTIGKMPASSRCARSSRRGFRRGGRRLLEEPPRRPSTGDRIQVPSHQHLVHAPVRDPGQDHPIQQPKLDLLGPGPVGSPPPGTSSPLKAEAVAARRSPADTNSCRPCPFRPSDPPSSEHPGGVTEPVRTERGGGTLGRGRDGEERSTLRQGELGASHSW